ncbi:MAG: hypothetical protein GY810_17955 [Aureispira sp.]|nr:hypothetical protein [Aureispira sp.]
MAVKEDKLFRLIKSMQKSEKIFFKKFAAIYRKEGASNYIQLFDAIDKQNVYDERKLLRKFKSTNISKYYSASKNYLYENILKSLKTFRQGKSTHSKVQQLKEDAQILVEKGLYEEAYKVVQKAKKIAYEIEYYPALLELIELENSFVGFVVKLTQELNDQIKKEQAKVIDIIGNQHFFAWTYYDISYLSKNYQFARSAEDLERLAKLIRQPSFKALELAKSHNARLHYCYANAIYHQLTGDHNQEWQFKRTMVSLWEGKTALQKENQRYYSICLISYAYSSYSNKKAEELHKTLELLQAIKPQTSSLEETLFFSKNTIASYYAKLTLDFKHFEDAVQEFQKKIESYTEDKFTTAKRSTYLNFLDTSIIKGDYALAQEWCWQIEQLPKTEVQQDAQYLSQLLALVVYFKQQNLELIESLCRSIEYKIHKDDKPYEYEHLFLKLFRKLQNTPEFEYSEVYTAYLNKFRELQSNPFEQQAFENFDILTWLEAELQKATMAAIYTKEKAHL